MSAPAALPESIRKLHERVAAINARRAEAAAAPQIPDEPIPCTVRRTVSTGQGRPTLHFDLQISGEVVEDCHARVEPGSGFAVVSVLLKQPHNGLPVLAIRRYDATPSSHAIARTVARRLRAGTTVHVSGKAIALATHQGKQVLQVLDVQTLEPPPELTTRKDLE